MNRWRFFLLFSLLIAGAIQADAREFIGAPSNNNSSNNNTTNGDDYRASCIESRSQTELNINNVRAMLRSGGDMWWDGDRARYVVPNVDPASGEPEVSSLFAGAVWLGAYDEVDNLILAAQTYRSSGNDFWTGPLNPADGTIDKSDCENWDRHFEVAGADIDALRSDFFEPDEDGVADETIDNTPSRGLLGWPARGNPHFAEIYGFELPDQDLAPFVDQNSDGVYDPYDGDHPVIEVTGCPTDYLNPVYADQMIWWVYNDNGNLHTQSNGLAMRMEVQVTAFSYRTTDAINNMTFYRYKLLNRNTLTLKDTYFSLWSDPDLGCFDDDKIGVDTVTGMGYVYNGDANDNVVCGSDGIGYGDGAIPALGVDYFRGPLDSAGNQIGLSSFQYHVNNNGPTGDPSSAIGFYRLISGYWPDGEPIVADISDDGDGYQVGTTLDPTPFVFPSWPSDESADAWSMCENGNTGADDFRFLHTSGPFILKPGATNEMISGVVWVPEIPDYPCPRLSELVEADELAQNLFDDCFKITDGPDAPYMDIVEMKNELVLNLSYTIGQNNYGLEYIESPSKLSEFEDSTYLFQGYLVYQVADANTSVTDLTDPEQARLIYQCDVQDSVSKIVNWSAFDDPDVINAFIPEIMVDGANDGISHTFRITEDAFATSDGGLVNHKPYYFCVVAYGYNEYQKYSPTTNEGQAEPFLQGRKNFRIYTGIPRDNSPEYYGAVINATYGDGPEITRVDGQGNGGGLFLNFVDQTTLETNILSNGAVSKITYSSNEGPINVKVVDPLRVAPGDYQLYISDENFTWNKTTTNDGTAWTPSPPSGATTLGDSLYWVLIDKNDNTEVWTSLQTLDVKTENYIPELGISLSIEQASTPGVDGTSGFIGSTTEYADSNATPWYTAIEDASNGLQNVLRTGNAQTDEDLDPEEDYSASAEGWYPVLLAGCEYTTADPYFSPNEVEDNSNSMCVLWKSSNKDKILSAQRNVNVVMTDDQSQWSRCIVVETASKYHSDMLGLDIPSGKTQLDWKNDQPSTDKDGNIESGSFGMAWFPGYAYDVETGERLNIFFGENSFFNGSFFSESMFPGSSNGNDMIYNPTDRVLTSFGLSTETNFLSRVYGGHHYIYVANSTYDECQVLVDEYNSARSQIVPLGFSTPHRVLRDNMLIWASMSYLQPGTTMGGTNGNVPPADVTFKLRVETPYKIYDANGGNGGYPLYEFTLDSLAPAKEDATAATSALDLINIVPNPYYAYSDYEVTETDNVIKFTNLPPQCDIQIYSLDGRFVRRFSVSQEYNATTKNGIARIGAFGSGDIEDQIVTSIDWDLKNQSGVPVASGVYLVHVVVDGVGERVLKSFIINRAFDPQKL